MKIEEMARVLLKVCASVLLIASSGLAQQPTGSVEGTAYDASSAAISGVQVTLRNVATGETKINSTNTEGHYEFPLLRPATYEITAEMSGFRRLHEQNVVVNVGAVVRVDLHFEVGEVSQTVEVSSAPPLIEPDKTIISRSVDLNAISNLPMLGRQILNLALTAPGTIPSAPGSQVNAFTVAGMRAQSNNYTLDGISNNDPQVNGPLNGFNMTDAIQEFNVQTSIASAEVGRNSGAQVNIITKSGTNDFHGTMFYLGRNDFFDATNFFLNKGGQKKNALRRHQFGGTAGGRLIRDKTFWFFSFEGFREKTATPVTGTVPTQAQRDAVTNPVSKKVLDFYPLPNTSGSRNWTGTAANVTNSETYFWRVDHNLTTNNRLTSRYAWLRGKTNSLQSTANPFHGNITNEPGQHNFLLQETWAVSKLVNEARVGFSRNHTFIKPLDVEFNPASIFTDAAGKPLPGFVDATKDPLDGGLPNITVTGLSGIGAGTNMPQGRSTNTYEAMDNLSLPSPFGFGRHTWRFGGGLRHEITNRFLNGNYRGQITFTSFSNCGTDANPRSCLTKGVPARGSLRTGEGGTFRTWSRNIWNYYALDSYKPIPNLTINYGIRWEYFGQSVEKHDRGSNFMPGVGIMALNSHNRLDISPTALGRGALILTPVDAFMPRSGQSGGDFNNYAPSLGIAWSPKILPSIFGDGKTVIRTGFRVNYDDIFANIPVNMGLNAPLVLSTTLPTRAYTWGTVLNQNRSLFATDLTVPAGRQGIVTFNAWDFNARTAYAMNYALEIERQLGKDYSVEVSYIGTQGRKLGVFVDPNQPFITRVDPTRTGDDPGPVDASGNLIDPSVGNRRTFPFSQYSGMGLGTFGANSNYNGMVATLRKRTSNGLSFTGSYTLGKALDDNSSFFGSDRDNGAYADTRNRKIERAASGNDVRHRVVATYIYTLPFGSGRRWMSDAPRLLRSLVGGWDTSGIFNYRSGFPFTVFAGTNNDFSGFNQFADRPNWAPGFTNLALNFTDPDNPFNCHAGPSTTTCPAFTAPIGGTVGNVGRNRFYGPRLINMDFAVMKNFPFGEKRRVQFRADFFNLFNHTNFRLPSSNILFNAPGASTVGSTTVGKIGTADPARIIQLGARIDF